MKKQTNNLILLVLMIALIISAGVIQKRLLNVQQETGMTRSDPLKDSPPLVAFTTVALGGFRGIIADCLWIRAARLQQEGKYFELVQLANWITQLEPRFGEVWAFHAWNLSYNISVLFNNPEERWRWVQNGINLLRDEGLNYNPGDAQLYYELGWLYQHKIGGSTDKMHQYYKEQWLLEMQNLFGGGRPEVTTNNYHQVVTTYRLDPELIRETEEAFGQLDWRLPETHALYWARQGLPFASESQKLNLERMIFQSLATAFMTGKLVSDPANDLLMRSPDPDLLPCVLKAYRQAMTDFPDNHSISHGYANFLKTAIFVCYTHNRTAEAQQLFAELKKDYPDFAPQPTIDQLVMSHLAEEVELPSPETVQATIEGLFYQSQVWSDLDDTNQAIGYANMAGLCWSNYMASRPDDQHYQSRMPLPPLNILRDQAKQQSDTLMD